MTVGPRKAFRAVAVTEAITWAGLLAGMWFKYVPEGSLQTEIGVRVFGPIHGMAFIAYCLVTVAVAVDQRWSARRGLLGLLAAVPPFFSVLFDRYAERRAALDDRWHSNEQSETRTRRAVSWLLRHERAALAVLAGAVAGLTGIALLVGPPVG